MRHIRTLEETLNIPWTVLGYYLNKPWCITREYLEHMVNIYTEALERKAQGIDFDPRMVETRTGKRLDNTRSVTIREDGVAILPINGPIMRYAGMFDDISGATSIDALAKDFDEAMNNSKVRAIILNVDSPGGEAMGTNELAESIYAARKSGSKIIKAYVDGSCCSGAFWIASAAQEIISDEIALSGCIGVAAVIRDTRERDEKQGIKTIEFVSKQTPNKRPDPATEKGADQIQQTLDEICTVFIAKAARNRGFKIEDFTAKFEGGATLVARHAMKAGLIDRIGSFEALVAEMADEVAPPRGRRSERDASGDGAPPVTQTGEEISAMADHNNETVNNGAPLNPSASASGGGGGGSTGGAGTPGPGGAGGGTGGGTGAGAGSGAGGGTGGGAAPGGATPAGPAPTPNAPAAPAPGGGESAGGGGGTGGGSTGGAGNATSNTPTPQAAAGAVAQGQPAAQGGLAPGMVIMSREDLERLTHQAAQGLQAQQNARRIKAESYVDGLIRAEKVDPYQREGFIARYLQAEDDDIANPKQVAIAYRERKDSEGSPTGDMEVSKTGTRLEAFMAQFDGLRGYGMSTEAIISRDPVVMGAYVGGELQTSGSAGDAVAAGGDIEEARRDARKHAQNLNKKRDPDGDRDKNRDRDDDR